MNLRAVFQQGSRGFEPRSGHNKICSGHSDTGADFLRVLRFPLPILIPQIVSPSLIIISWTLYIIDTASVIKWLTSWSWALLEKPPVVQLLGTRLFITVFTVALESLSSQLKPEDTGVMSEPADINFIASEYISHRGWFNCNALDIYSGDIPFDSRPGKTLS
jgi:hypothetical protein